MQELPIDEEADETMATDVKETSEVDADIHKSHFYVNNLVNIYWSFTQSPSTTPSDSSDIEILNDDQIPMPPTRPPTAPSPLLGEYEGCELYFSDLEGILGTGKVHFIKHSLIVF